MYLKFINNGADTAFFVNENIFLEIKVRNLLKQNLLQKLVSHTAPTCRHASMNTSLYFLTCSCNTAETQSHLKNVQVHVFFTWNWI